MKTWLIAFFAQFVIRTLRSTIRLRFVHYENLERLQQAMAKKRASKDAANSFFKS